MKKILIPTKLDNIAAEHLQAQGGYEVVQDDATSLQELLTQHQDTYGLIVRSEPITADVMEQLPELQVIIRAGAGYNTIDTRAARARKIDVMNTPGANSNAVAEEVIAMMLADARHIVAADPSVRAGRWEKKHFMGTEISHKTVGIVGLGYIGQLVATRLAGFSCNLLGYDPIVSPDKVDPLGVQMTSLEELFAQSDYVTLHMPENKETKGIISTALLTRMKPGATLINCARAGILDEEALRTIKQTKNIRFLNDVYPKDAEGPKSVADIADLMLPHLGASTREANTLAAQRAAEQLIDYDQKGTMSFVVNREIPIGLDEQFCDLAYTVAHLCRNMVGDPGKVKRIETSIYGSLSPYAEWLCSSIISGVYEDFQRASEPSETLAFLSERGVSFQNREVDPSKRFENSITVDLTAEVDREIDRHVSIRGTVEEGVLLISRINQFDKLYFEAAGPVILFLYEDRIGVVGTIGQILAEEGINIEDMRDPHDLKSNRSLAILKVDQLVSQDALDRIHQAIEAIRSFRIAF